MVRSGLAYYLLLAKIDKIPIGASMTICGNNIPYTTLVTTNTIAKPMY